MAVLNFPSNPVDGQAYVAPNGSTYIYDATETVWKAQGADGDNTVVVSATAPVSPTQGKLWWNTTTGTLFIYYQDGDSNQWIPAAIPGPASILDGQSVIFEDISVKSLNNGPLAGLRNQLINADFRIWQRGETFGGFTYSADRWLTSDTNVAHSSVDRLDTALVTGGNRQFMTSVELPLVGNPSAYGPGPFTVGSTWTVSLYTTGQPQVDFGFTDSVLGGGSDVVVLPVTALTKTGKTIGILEQWSLTFTVNALPAATNQALRVKFTFGGDSQLTMVQLEPGPVATPFENRPIGLELSLCQRYYETIGICMAGIGVSSGTNYASANFVTKRIIPTVTFSPGGGTVLHDNTWLDSIVFRRDNDPAQASFITLDAEL